MAGTETARGLRIQLDPEPTEPAPTPASPATADTRSRSNSPVTPLNTTDCSSYGTLGGSRPAPCHIRLAANSAESAGCAPGDSHSDSKRNTEAKQSHKLRFLNSRYSPYLLLENSGSVARDHLASERTFLAYVRTSLAIAAAGVALVQLLSVSSTKESPHQLEGNVFRFARPLGATLVVISILVLGIGFARYFRIQAALIAGQFPLARFAVASVSSILALLVIVIFAVLVQATK